MRASCIASVDGVISDPALAHVPATDEGLLRGDGVFEVVRVYGGRPFAMDEHLRRMSGSAANLRLEIDLGALQADADAVLDAGGPVDAALRMLVTRGGRRIALLELLTELPETLALALVTYAPTRIMDGVKSLSYAPNMLATRLAQERGCDEALLVTPHGRVLEAPTCSFFYALGGDASHAAARGPHPRLDHAPPRDRASRRAGARRRRVTICAATEAFLASTLREVHPVARIEDRELAAPGPLSHAAASAVAERIRRARGRR